VLNKGCTFAAFSDRALATMNLEKEEMNFTCEEIRIMDDP